MSIITEQLSLPTAERDLDWIRTSLQRAIELEHATLPLYTSAMLSLEVQNYPTYNCLRSVLMEEMVHMSIAANLLAAIGGSPRMASLDPGYPTRGLPGGAEPDLHVGLACLSRRQLSNFMRIEAPVDLLPPQYRTEDYPTIGRFYKALREAFVDNADDVRAAVLAGGPAHQVGDDIGFATFGADGQDPLPGMLAGLDEIMSQGEGATPGGLVTGAQFEYEESHYARFAELRYGARYTAPVGVALMPETEPEFFRGEALAWPRVVNTLAVPGDGYDRLLAEDPDGASAAAELDDFDHAYTGRMVHLARVWNGSPDDQWPTLGEAITHMMKLRVFSCFTFQRRRIPADVTARLTELYPQEADFLAAYTDLDRPVFYGPRFRNRAAGPREAR
jgi:hypothetical protein